MIQDQVKWQPNAKLTRKENAFVKYMVNHPKDSATQAAVESYDVKNRQTAATIAKEVKKRPRVAAELAKYETTAETNLIKLANASTDYAMANDKVGAAYAAVSERLNNSILDRLQGKPIQRVQTQSIAVNINVDLSAA